MMKSNFLALTCMYIGSFEQSMRLDWQSKIDEKLILLNEAKNLPRKKKKRVKADIISDIKLFRALQNDKLFQ